MTGAGEPLEHSEQLLPELPALSRLHSRAVGRTGMLMLSRSPLRAAELPRVSYRVEGVRADAEQLSAYQHLLGEPGTDVLPAGYVHVLAFPLAMAVMVREDFPLPVLGLVHVANRVVQHRPVHLAETLTVRAYAADLRPHQRGTQVDLVVTVDAEDGRVWEGISTYLAKGRSADGAGAPERSGEASGDSEPAATALWRLGTDVGRRYAEVSGDRNPIHVSRLGARIFGFRRPIAHGMYTAARALSAVGPARGDSFTWEVQFAKPVLLPGSVALSLERAGAGYRFVGRHPRSGKAHLSGAVRPH